MIALIVCLFAFIATYMASRRSLAAGIGVVLTIGYFYGIVRANITQTFSHFIFDGAVLALYTVHLLRKPTWVERRRGRGIQKWVTVMIAWAVLLFLIPIQTYPVQAVGLRGTVFLLPFLLLGARLTSDDLQRLAIWCAALNIIAFVFATAEFFNGVEAFYPRSAVTEIIYRSRAIDNNIALRIPATFSNAHAYAGVMVMTLPLLLGIWAERRNLTWQRPLIALGVVSACIGVFMAATRMYAILFFFLLLVTTLSRKVSMRSRAAWAVVIVIVAVVVAQNERLQRFRTLEDVEFVSDRVSVSVNSTFLDLAAKFPLGNGLGGGGTSMPYFLQGAIRNPVVLENEYARIMLEQGIPGLVIWVAFLAWLLTRPGPVEPDGLRLTRRLAWYACAVNFGSGMIGTGLFASIPLTALLLLLAGWAAAPTASHVRRSAQPHDALPPALRRAFAS